MNERIGMVRLRPCAAALACVLAWTAAAGAHVYIFLSQRTGSAPCTPGTGWQVECFYDIPDEDATNLISAEHYADEHAPTFTFEADYLEWPSGPDIFRADASFQTMGDFLDGHLLSISDPAALDLPFRTFLLRAHGQINARVADSNFPDFAPEVWLEFAIACYDGGRLRLGGTTIFRSIVPTEFVAENAIIEFPGVYPITVTYFNRYDPTNAFEMSDAGFEFLSCNAAALPTSTSEYLPCNFAEGGIAPPHVIYDSAEIADIVPGDWDVDNDVDLADVARFQRCFTGPGSEEPPVHDCGPSDLDGDNDIDADDFRWLLFNYFGPGVCLYGH